MKKIICLIAMTVTLIGIPCFAAHGKNPGDIPGRKQVPMHTPIGHSLDRPIHMQRHPVAVLPPHIETNRPLPLSPITYRPYYSYYSYYPYSYYYPTITTVTPITADVSGVVVSDPYAEINTTANVINAAANVATMIRFWTW